MEFNEIERDFHSWFKTIENFLEESLIYFLFLGDSDEKETKQSKVND